MMQLLYIAHWLIPWLILVVGMYTFVRFVRGHIDDQTFTGADRRLVIVFTGLMDLQAAAGLLFFLSSGSASVGYPVYRILHGIVMFIAVVIPHLSFFWQAPDESSTPYINYFYFLLASFLLMLVGMAIIP